jgi:hypothetical protein
MARPGRPERNRAAQSFRQLRRFHHVINSDEVFGTHRPTYSSWSATILLTGLEIVTCGGGDEACDCDWLCRPQAASAGRSRIVSRLAVLSVGISVGMKLTRLPKNWIAQDIVRIANGCISGCRLCARSRPRRNRRGKLPSLSSIRKKRTDQQTVDTGSRERNRQTIDTCCG